jgi:hypothetical protein
MSELAQILERLERLEAVVFHERPSADEPTQSEQNHSGLAGGIRFLVGQDFSSCKRTAPETRDELATHGYHYTIAAIQTALNRVAVKSGPLTAFTEGGKKIYVRRK